MASQQRKEAAMITTIRVKRGTKELLDGLKIIDRESYDTVIARVASGFVEANLDLNRETLELLDKRMKNLEAGRAIPLSELLQKLKARGL